MITNFTDADIPNQKGKTFFITGANTGIGFETAKAIAGQNGRVLLGCRSPDKGREAIERIKVSHPHADVMFVPLDLADLASVRNAAQIVGQESRLDVLINNAGVMWTPKTMTKDGFELQFGVNHLGHFALTGLLLPKLMEAANARIVTISSNGHKQGTHDLYWDDLHAEKHYSRTGRYFASKLANLLFTYELDRRLRARGSSTIAVAAHPGGANTDLPRYITGFWGLVLWILTPVILLFANTAEQGAWPTELAATHPDVHGGQYFGPNGRGEMAGEAQEVDSSNASKDLQKAKRLWDLSIELTGVDPGI